MKEKELTERTAGWYLGENILLYPGQIALIKLSYPRCFIRCEDYGASYFSSFEDWKDNLIVVDWLDPKDKPNNSAEIDEILIDAWNFLSLSEKEEDSRISEEYDEDEYF